MNFSHEQKKRLIRFSNIYDYNFLLYNTLIILNDLNCYGDKKFKDYRKLPVLIELLTADKLRNVVLPKLNEKVAYSKEDQDLLYALIGRAKYVRKQVLQLLLSLKRLDFIDIDFYQDKLDISIKNTLETKAIISNDIFENDIKNIKLINSSIQRVRITKYETFLHKIFDSKGVFTWQL